MPDKHLLIGDIGGTNARFALAKPDAPGYVNEQVLRCAEFASPEQAIETYLADVQSPTPEVICLAAAGPIVDGRVRFTNNSWALSTDALRAAFDTEHACLLNDFEAIALSLPLVSAAHCTVIGGVPATDLAAGDFTVAVLGPGTGLGAAGLIRRGAAIVPLVTEAGHVGFAPESVRQRQIREVLGERYGRVSDERLVSGMGLENIYWALQRIAAATPQPLSAAAIFACAGDASDALATEAIGLFYEMLGQVAGNLALALGAFDGIYLAGGIVQRYPALLVSSRFRHGFESKGRHRTLMQSVPTLLVQHPQPGLLGASEAARRLLPPA